MPSNESKKQLSEKQDFEITEEMESNMEVRLETLRKDENADLTGLPHLEKKDEDQDKDDDKDKDKDENEDEDKDKDKDKDKDEDKDKDKDDDDDEDQDKDDDKDKDKDENEDEDKDKDKDEKKEHVLPENYFQSMRHVGWTPEMIKSEFERDPEQALKTFKTYHDSQNYITQQTSDLGRAHKAQTDRATKEATSKDTKLGFKGVDLKAIQDEFGEDNPAAVAVIKAMNESNKLMFDEVQALKQEKVKEAGPSDEQKVIWNTIVTHFDSDDLKGFNEFYGKVKVGKNWEHGLTGAQLQVRMKVIQEADAYHAGMELQGKKVEYSEALRCAHLVVSAPVQEKILREELHGKVKKRSKGITVKSSGRITKDTKENKAKKSEKGFIEKTKDRLEKLTGRRPDS